MNKVILPTLITITLIVMVTFGVIKFLSKNAPEAEKKITEAVIPVVEIISVSRGDVRLPLTSEGIVLARRESVLSAEVSGKIIEVHPNFEPGGTFNAGEVIIRLDDTNYHAALAQAKSSLADARLTLKQEEARGGQALRDWQKIGGGRTPSELVLRVPFLKSAQARVESAAAMVNKATEDLDRTQIRAPFHCRVLEAGLDLGAMVVAGAQLGSVYDHSKFIVRLPFSLDDFSQVPKDSQITLSAEIGGRTYKWGSKVMWEDGNIDRATLSAFVIVEVLPNGEAPDRFKFPPAGLFVNASIEGAMLKDVVSVPRSALRKGKGISVLNDENQLEFRDLEIVRSSAETVYVSKGVKDGERIILTKLELPIAGMRLEVAEAENP